MVTTLAGFGRSCSYVLANELQLGLLTTTFAPHSHHPEIRIKLLDTVRVATINMQLELGLRYLRISNFRDAAQRCCPFLDQSVDREANENSIKRTTSTPAAADPAGCADYLSLA